MTQVLPLTQPWLALAQVAGKQLGRALVQDDGRPVNGSGWKNAVASVLGVSYNTVASRLSGALPIPATWYQRAGLNLDGTPCVSVVEAPVNWLATWSAAGQALSAMSVPDGQRLTRDSLDSGREMHGLLASLLGHLRDLVSGIAVVPAWSASYQVPVGERFNGCPVVCQILDGDGSVAVKRVAWVSGKVCMEFSAKPTVSMTVAWFVDGRRK